MTAVWESSDRFQINPISNVDFTDISMVPQSADDWQNASDIIFSQMYLTGKCAFKGGHFFVASSMSANQNVCVPKT